MLNLKEYAFVLDTNGQQLNPTLVNNAWRLVRQKKAKLISKFPMVIQLNKVVNNLNQDKIFLGIDDGASHIGIALVQKCLTRNKVLFKGVIEQRKDVHKLMEQRKAYRHYHRYHKWFRPKRFDNRASSKRTGRLAPSIKQKKQAILRVVDKLSQWIRVDQICLEDVKIDIRALVNGYKPYKWQYQQSNRLDENLRVATILRDGCCMECGKIKTSFEVHHITPRKNGGSDTLSNLITLCSHCHQKTFGRELSLAERYYSMIKGKNLKELKYAQHVMQGKTWLHEELSKRSKLILTTGCDTANKRFDWDIEKSHSNDAICITGLKPEEIEVVEYTIKPMRRQSKAKTDNVLGIKHHDLVEYTFKNGETHRGYVTALYPELNALNFQSKTKHCKKVNAKKCKLLWKFNKIYWLKCA